MQRTGKSRAAWRLWAGSGAALVALLVVAAALELFVLFPARPAPGSGKLVEIEVPAGAGPRGLAALLYGAGTVSCPEMFALWLRTSGKMPGIKAGRFRVADNLTAERLTEVLSGPGIDKGTKIVIPEGFTLSRICEALEKSGIVGCDEFTKAATDKALFSSIGIPGPTAEGYLFPDTYFFLPSQKADRIIVDMFRNLEAHLSSLGSPRGQDLKRLATLASIVQAEAKSSDEMPTIAGVYTNRLDGSKFPSRLLQADPTVGYGCEPFVSPRAPSCNGSSQSLTRAQLDDPLNPYNTYQHQGLPPGPICSPGFDALKAANKPAEVPYFYFVADNKGRHLFSVSLGDHNKAVERYKNQR